jgi:tRNA modification GTPase
MKPSLSQAETYVACLTPGGTAAIATLAVRGPHAAEVLRDLFRPHSRAELPAEPAVGSIWLGKMSTGQGRPGLESSEAPAARRHDLADQVVLTVKARHPVPWLEIHCHGGAEVTRWLQETLELRGIQGCSWQEFERLTEPDPLRAAAVIALPRALTVRTAAILLDQYHGAFARAVEAVASACKRGAADEAGRLLKTLHDRADVGRHLVAPWRVVVAGATNVGKSSLVNALAGFQRCVVAATPGTTRDVVTTLIAVDGWPVELADTAGWREATDKLEAQGLGRAQAALAAADLCVWVLDASDQPAWPDLAREKTQFIINKTDLPPASDLNQAAGAVCVSARTGQGLDELCQKLATRLVPEPPLPGTAVPFTVRLSEKVEEAWNHCCTGRWADAVRTLASAEALCDP